MKLLLFLLQLSLFLSYSFAQSFSPNNSLPNIVILLADDLGYGDLRVYGGIAQTPHLDKLAHEGLMYTEFYSAAPNCSPARAGLLTGRSPSMVGMYNYLPVGHPMHLKDEEITLAEILKQKGYRTGLFGKWHVGCIPQRPELNQPQPSDQGFDYYLGTSNNAQPSHLNPTNFYRNGEKVGEMQGYSCDIIVDEALQFLDHSSEDDPFFLFLPFHEPHKKVASPPELTAKYTEYGPKSAEYFANVENMDAAIGRLLQGLATRNLDKNTLIIFASDNGSYRNGSNGNLLGGKSFVYEGGIRVPGIFHWKGQIKGGQTSDQAAGLVDIMPTICELTGSTHPRIEQLDGTSLVPLFAGEELERKKPLSWFFYRTSPEIAMRIGDYTILGKSMDSLLLTHPISQPDMDHIKNLELTAFELYDVKKDPAQKNPLDLSSHNQGEEFKQLLIARLEEIQREGPYWDNLPPPGKNRQKKTEWRKLRPDGFSN